MSNVFVVLIVFIVLVVLVVLVVLFVFMRPPLFCASANCCGIDVLKFLAFAQLGLAYIMHLPKL